MPATRAFSVESVAAIETRPIHHLPVSPRITLAASTWFVGENVASWSTGR